MRTEVGLLPLDKLFNERVILNKGITFAMKEPAEHWGAVIHRFEITDICPTSEAVSESLNMQATADRERRETGL